MKRTYYENLVRIHGNYAPQANKHTLLVKRFAEDVVAPKVREMDENENMDPAIIQGLFEQGVSSYHPYVLLFDRELNS